MDTPNFLKDLAPDLIDQDSLTRLESLVKEYKDYEEKIEKAEQYLKEYKQALQAISRESIPTLLRTHGLSEIKLRTGDKVVVKEGVSVSVPVDKEGEFLAFLKQRHEEDIVKMHFHFDRMPEEQMVKLFEFLTDNEYAYATERGVHPSTLKKYFRELLGIGDEEQASGVASGKYLRKEDIAHIANIFTFFDTKLK